MSNYKTWTREYELEHWKAREDEYYLKPLRRRFDMFKITDDCLPFPSASVLIDVGGGKFGGALRFFSTLCMKVLIDKLAIDFWHFGKLPIDVMPIVADFANIPLPDNYADAVFAWEVFDHAISIEHMETGISEIQRIARPGGLLFVHHIFRNNPGHGHTVLISENDFMGHFEKRCALEWFRKEGNQIYARFRKR